MLICGKMSFLQEGLCWIHRLRYAVSTERSRCRVQSDPFQLCYATSISGVRSAEFLKNIRSYNAALAFTSCELKADNRLGNNARYLPVRMQGQSVHRTGSTRMHDRHGARYGQIYFYDGEEAASIRNANNQNRLDEGLLTELDAMLRECNPYYQIYKNIRDITQEYEAQHPDMRVGITPQLKLFLETGKDRKRENLPQQYEVAALIPSEWAEPCDDEAFHMDNEYLHTLEASGIPPARLTLKVGAPVILMRNMNPAKGFCNSTRCIVKRMHSRALEIEIASGEFQGRSTTLPRILCNSKTSDFGFILTRRQFPVQLCFAISINKSQGQSLPEVGLDLRNSVFSHGQLYVALSRVTDVSKLHVLLRDQASRIVENIVWPELLLPQETAM